MALRLSDLHDGELVGPVNEVPPGKGCLLKRFLALLESNLNRRFSSFPHGQNIE